ncbi:perlucin-like [Mercenaria mercenaria]|uniref:perlucin-like n=1 Tax=Mercenaria mercenaria TaxID=6596 RepID=UPI00234EB854|nr:perlucin-like [Mercenaria mercenaria]
MIPTTTTIIGIIEYRVVEVKKPWDEAQKYCEDLGEHLADIKSEAEETFLERNVFHGYNTSIWLGATDVESEGTFVWWDGTNVSDFYVNWSPSQPNNYDGMEHCLKSAKVKDRWQWRDGKCFTKLFSLCEFD